MVEARFRAAGYEVLDTYPLSVGRGVELLHVDGFHFDRDQKNPNRWSSKLHIGELSVQVLMTFLNIVCNPELQDSGSRNGQATSGDPKPSPFH